MLQDPRARALATRFAVLWLRLQDLEGVEPDSFLFPNFRDQLRADMRQETEHFFYSLIREDRSLLDLIRARAHVAREELPIGLADDPVQFSYLPVRRRFGSAESRGFARASP